MNKKKNPIDKHILYLKENPKFYLYFFSKSDDDFPLVWLATNWWSMRWTVAHCHHSSSSRGPLRTACLDCNGTRCSRPAGSAVNPVSSKTSEPSLPFENERISITGCFPFFSPTFAFSLSLSLSLQDVGSKFPIDMGQLWLDWRRGFLSNHEIGFDRSDLNAVCADPPLRIVYTQQQQQQTKKRKTERRNGSKNKMEIKKWVGLALRACRESRAHICSHVVMRVNKKWTFSHGQSVDF